MSTTLAAGINYTDGKFATCINDTGGKFSSGIGTAGVVDTSGKFATSSCEYLCEFSKKIQNGLNGILGTQGLRGNCFMKKTGRRKSRGIVPLMSHLLLYCLNLSVSGEVCFPFSQFLRFGLELKSFSIFGKLILLKQFRREQNIFRVQSESYFLHYTRTV